MAPAEVKRKLAAILSADVKGYSRLMGVDEVGTIRALTSLRESGQYEEAIATFTEGIARYSEYILSRYALVTTYCAAGRYEEARVEAQQIFRIDPRFNLEKYTMGLPYKDRAVNDRLLADLRQAGLLE